MLKMNRTGLLNLYFSGCLLFGIATAFAEDVTGKGIAEVTLEVPYPTRLYNEAEQFTVRLKNISVSDLIYIPKESEAAGKQVFIKVGRGDAGFEARMKNSPTEYRIPQVEEFRWEDVEKGVGLSRLAPGQTAEWHGVVLAAYGNFSLNQGDPQSIQASILVGDGQWVSSNPVPIKQIPQMVNDFPIIYTYISEKHKELKMVMTRVYRGTVEGVEYLFSGGAYRICKIPQGVTPKFNFEESTEILGISFDEVKEERDVFFDARKGYVTSSVLRKKTAMLETKLPVTNTPPAFPKAEAIQPAVKQAVSSNVIQAAASPSVAQPEKPRNKAWWLIAGVAILGVIVWSIRRK